MRRWLLFIMAVVMAGCTTYLFHNYTKEMAVAQTSVSIPMTTVVVAKEAIPNQTQITDKMVETRSVPKDSLQPDTLTSLDQVVGKWTLVSIQPDELLLAHHVVATDKATRLSYKVQPGDRAMTITAGRIADTVANLVQPGDHVDVLLSAKTGSGVVLTNVLVLAVDQRMSDSAPETGKTAQAAGPYTMTTLEVSPTDAIKIVEAEQKGDLRLILRSARPGA